jgi:hypothetical protein
MGEKRGNLEKLVYDFDTSKCVQGQYDTNGPWYQLTQREFRSFNGQRRIVTWNKGTPIYIEYKGPIFYFGTNIKAKETYGIGIQYIHNEKPKPKHTLAESYRYS